MFILFYYAYYLYISNINNRGNIFNNIYKCFIFFLNYEIKTTQIKKIETKYLNNVIYINYNT